MTKGWLAMVAVALALSSPARGQPPRLTADEFRTRFNAVLQDQGLKLQLGGWKPDAPGGATLTASMTRNVRLFAQQDRDRRLTSILFVMHTGESLESLAEIVTAVAATTYALHPELTEKERGALFTELGLFDDSWSVRGLDGVAVREGLIYRVIHPGGDALVIALVSWPGRSRPLAL